MSAKKKKQAKRDPVDVAIGAAIRRERRAKEKTQEELGDAAGITFQQVQKYEAGANRLPVSMFLKMAKFLRCDPGELLNEIVRELQL